MSFLTIAKVDPSRTDVALDIADRNRMHKRLMSLYPNGLGESPRQKINLLFAVDEPRSTIVIQSDLPPTTSELTDDSYQYFTSVDTSVVTTEYEAGQAVRFELDFAGLVRKSESGKRVAITDTDAALDKARVLLTGAGLDIQELYCIGTDPINSAARGVRYHNYKITGQAVVSDSQALKAAIRQGVGGGRLWGSALIAISPITN